MRLRGHDVFFNPGVMTGYPLLPRLGRFVVSIAFSKTMESPAFKEIIYLVL